MSSGGGRRALALVVGWLLGSSALQASTASTVEILCEPVYMPARSVWRRSVQIVFDEKQVRGVSLDGVPVHSFNVIGDAIITALDNERIRVDVASLRWRSDLRGVVLAQGSCERLN